MGLSGRQRTVNRPFVDYSYQHPSNVVARWDLVSADLASTVVFCSSHSLMYYSHSLATGEILSSLLQSYLNHTIFTGENSPLKSHSYRSTTKKRSTLNKLIGLSRQQITKTTRLSKPCPHLQIASIRNWKGLILLGAYPTLVIWRLL